MENKNNRLNNNFIELLKVKINKNKKIHGLRKSRKIL